MGWNVVEVAGLAGELHEALLPATARSVRRCSVTAPALVLGSAQRLGDEPCERARSLDLQVVRRRSGGGAVLLAPDAQVWLDVMVPRGDDRWDDDVGRSGWWLGDAWARALEALGLAGAEVHRGRIVQTALSDVVCFAGLGPGEVTVGGAKVVGVSQRRTREGAVFQCTVPLEWDPSPLVEVFAIGPHGAAALADAAAPLGVLLGRPVEASELVSALISEL